MSVNTEREQNALQNKAKNEVERLEQILSDESTIRLLDRFKNKFNVCETAYKIFLAQYLKCQGKSHKKDLVVSMTQVPAVLSFAGYNFDKTLLNELFGSKSKSGKTVKILRNAVSHGINQKAVEEISARQDELFGYMDCFLDTIKTFDKTVA